MGQQFAIDKVLGIVDDQHHDGLGYHVPRGLCDDLHIRIDQITNGLHLTLQLWIGRALLIGRLYFFVLVSVSVRYRSTINRFVLLLFLFLGILQYCNFVIVRLVWFMVVEGGKSKWEKNTNKRIN